MELDLEADNLVLKFKSFLEKFYKTLLKVFGDFLNCPIVLY